MAPNPKEFEKLYPHRPDKMKQELEEFASKYGLSPRERDILGLLANKVVNFKDIAAKLNLSPSTVNNHFKNIFEKTGTNSKSELLAACLMRVNDKYAFSRHLVKKPEVLIVDDETEICEVVEKGLSLRGVKVHVFSDPIQAIQSVGDLKLDVVISDIRMPKMDGIELLRQLRKAHRYFPAFVFFTGYHEEKSLERFMDMGAAALMEKPLDIEELFQVIMEQFVDDSEERDRLLGIGNLNPLELKDTFELGVGRVGYGGVFLPVTESLEVTAPITFRFRLSDQEGEIRALGRVAWKRSHPQGGMPAGVGVKFLKIAEQDRRKIHEFVRAQKSLSFIPLGVTSENKPTTAL